MQRQFQYIWDSKLFMAHTKNESNKYIYLSFPSAKSKINAINLASIYK